MQGGQKGEVGAADEAKAGLVRWLCFVLRLHFFVYKCMFKEGRKVNANAHRSNTFQDTSSSVHI